MSRYSSSLWKSSYEDRDSLLHSAPDMLVKGIHSVQPKLDGGQKYEGRQPATGNLARSLPEIIVHTHFGIVDYHGNTK